jgi:Tfp pilus assembly protein PilF
MQREEGRMAAPPSGGRGARLAAGLAIGAVLALAAALSWTRATDTDLFWHLASGDLIRSTGSVPRAEPFSYTAPGRPFIEVHWLFQVVLSWLFQRGGFALLEALRLLIVVGLFAFLAARARRYAGAPATAAVLLLAVLASQERFLTRPEIVSWVFFAATLALLDEALYPAVPVRRRRRIVWAVLPILQVVWANVQGLFMLGPAMILLALLAAAFEALPLALPGARSGRAAAVDRVLDFLVGLALASCACLANPYGARALRLPFEQAFVQLGGRSLLSRTIAEFQPPLTASPTTPSIAAFVVLLALAALALLWAGPRARPFDLFVAAATSWVALRARRNIPLFAIAALPVILRSGVSALRARRARAALAGRPGPPERARARVAGSLAVAALATALVGAVVTNVFFLHPPTERWWGSGPIPSYFPDQAARFVEEERLAGQVFHPLAAGGFLIHAWGGQRRVFIDGRNDPYLDAVLQTYLEALADPRAFEEAARRYQITTVLWPHQRAREGRALLSYLAHSEEWMLAHLDPGAAVYVRADLAPNADLPLPSVPEGGDREAVYADLEGRLAEQPFRGPPIREIALAEFFSATGDPRGAHEFYRKALESLPRSPALLQDDGVALERLGKKTEARASYEAALAADPHFLPAVAALGSMLLEEGRVAEAARRLEEAYRGGEHGPRLLLARARLLDRQGKGAEAVAAYQEALHAAPHGAEVLAGIGAFYARRRQPEAALDFYSEAAAAAPDDAGIAGATVLLLDSLGRPTAALAAAREAARRAAGRIDGGRREEEDRSIILLAARLEARAGEREKAASWLAVLSRAGLLGDEEVRADPDLRRLSVGPSAGRTSPPR